MRKKSIVFITCVCMLMISACGGSGSTVPTVEASKVSGELAESQKFEHPSLETTEASSTMGSFAHETTASAAAPSATSTMYIFTGSENSVIPDADLRKTSKADLRIARNEILARHGRKFKDAELQKHFESTDWYQGTVDPDEFDKNITGTLNAVEIANIHLIQFYEGLYTNGMDPGAYMTVDETLEEIRGKGFQNDEYMKYPNTSVLGFTVNYTTMVDIGDYYLAAVEIEKMQEVPNSLAPGVTVTITRNELTGEKVDVTMMDDGVCICSDGDRFTVWETEGKRVFMYAEGSDDIVYCPYAKGLLRINHHISVGYFGSPEATIDSRSDNRATMPEDYLNGVSFDDEGYVTAMLYYGD